MLFLNNILKLYSKSCVLKNLSFFTCTKRNYVCENVTKSLSPVDLAFSCYKPEKKEAFRVPIIILHGFLGSKQNWRSIAKAIAKRTERTVYVLDARNHGDSPHSEDFSISLMSADLKCFMTKQYIPEAVLIGHSMGGRTAVHFSITFKDLVKKLIVVDISPNKMPIASTLSPTYMKIMKEAITAVADLSLYKARKSIDEYLAKTIPESEIRQFLLTNLTEKEKRIAWKPNLDSLLDNFETGVLEMPPLSSHYMGETLFICGEKSPFVTANDYPRIKSLFPNAQIMRIVGAGHWVHSEKPSDFLDAVCNFI